MRAVVAGSRYSPSCWTHLVDLPDLSRVDRQDLPAGFDHHPGDPISHRAGSLRIAALGSTVSGLVLIEEPQLQNT